jgi:sigma-B regulation protein RsbU (phosphoserine phosphatase)
MQLQAETKGLILLGKRMNNISYSEADIEFISSLGSLAITSLENRRLFLEELEKLKLEEELELAKDIQKNLFPKELPEFNNYDIAATSISSKQVGGDYYDIINLGDQKYCVAIGDVSGKGIPASLLMANLQAFLKSICKQKLDISSATGLINDLVSENTSDGRFITFYWGHICDHEKKLTYVNAGHNPPLLIRNKTITSLDKGGIIFGVMKTMMPYINDTIQLQSGDLIVMFTDGVTEAKNIDDEEFSDQRLENILLENCYKSASEILDKIKQEINDFAKGQIQSDDITIIVIRVK